jgi:SPP1 gp7 family putative phage head morphogenesis protein
VPHVARHTPVSIALRFRQRRTRRKLPRPPKALSIRPIERRYRERIVGILEAARRILEGELLHRLSGIAAQVPGIRRDEWTDELEEIFARIRAALAVLIRGGAARSAAEETARATAQKNLESLRRQLSAVLGSEVLVPERNIAPMLAAFASENSTIVAGAVETYAQQVHAAVMRAYRDGLGVEDARAAVAERFGVAKSRAAGIARDQVFSLNGNLARDRQTGLGISDYVWRTQLDEKVRPNHASKEGKRFNWNEPPSDTGHPGQDWNCRCEAEPVIETLEEREAMPSGENF